MQTLPESDGDDQQLSCSLPPVQQDLLRFGSQLQLVQRRQLRKHRPY